MRTTSSRRTPRRTARVRSTALSTVLALAAGTVAGATVAPSAAAAEVPEPDLHYSMEEITSTTVPDVSGHGLDGTVAGSTSVVTAEGGGSALDLAGGSGGGYVTIPRGALEGATDLTVTARVRWDGVGGAWQRIFDLGTNTQRYLFATPSNGGGSLRTAVTTNGGGAEAQVTGYGPLRTGDWVTVTTTLDTTADRVTMYLDGVAVASAATTISAGQLLDASAPHAGYIGKSFYPDPLLDGAVDDFRIYRSALTAGQVAELVGELPTATGVATSTYDVTTSVGVAPKLPATTRATFSDGYDRDVPVTWDAVDPAQYAARGTFTVSGQAAGSTVTATVTVKLPGELIVDLGTDTGAFHGGASGTLYGLYGEGVPSQNLIEGMALRTVSTKAQDGPQHPGADALEVVRPLADATDGDVYIYMTDIHRGFPYEWPGATPEEKLDTYLGKIANQVDQVLQLPAEYQDNIVFVPFNEPEGNMFGTGQWSYNRVSWLNNPTHYFAAWDKVYALIKDKMPDARISGPNTSILYSQVKGFLQHTVKAGTVPEVITWHELSHPQSIRDSVARYRGWEDEVFAGTKYAGTHLPININEYAFNYHTSVPGQMIQWVAAIEESKVDADIAYWNIDGNLSDSAVQANRANGQWWLLNAYASMTGHTVKVTPPSPGRNYTLQGVATLDEDKRQSRVLFGGAAGEANVIVKDVPADVFGDTVHVTVREVPWTGQIGDSAQPRHRAALDLAVTGSTVSLAFDGKTLPLLDESSAYEVVVTPGGAGTTAATDPVTWTGSFEAEAAKYTGTGYSRNGPEGSPSNVSKFYTSGGYNVGGLRTGSNGVLDFQVTVPQDGTYDLSVFANSLNTFGLVAEQGPTNVFLRVDGGAEQELFLPLGYKWVVWDHVDTTVELTAGTHTISLAAASLDGTGATRGDAIVDRITLTLPSPTAGTSVYEAELATLDGAAAVYEPAGLAAGTEVSGSGAARVAGGQTATFWVYSEDDAAARLVTDVLGGGGSAEVTVNGHAAGTVDANGDQVRVSLSGGINKVVLTGAGDGVLVDRLRVTSDDDALPATSYQAEDATLSGSAAVVDLSLAAGDKAVDGIGGEPGNTSALTFDLTVEKAGTYAMRVRYSNPEQSPASHYNPDPIARRADISVNGGTAEPVLFPHSFHQNNFWVLTVPVQLEAGKNSIRFSSHEAPNFDGVTLASEQWPDFPLRSRWAPVVDSIEVAPMAVVSPVSVKVTAACSSSRPSLDVRVTNTSDATVPSEIATALGTRDRGALGAGKTWTETFPARSTTLGGGVVTVTADGVSTEHGYGEVTCS